MGLFERIFAIWGAALIASLLAGFAQALWVGHFTGVIIGPQETVGIPVGVTLLAVGMVIVCARLVYAAIRGR